MFNFYALQFGESSLPYEYVTDETTTVESIYVSWFFYLLELEDQIILIDTGFSDKRYNRIYNINNYSHPLVLLESINILPKDVSHIILTHSHFDHIGGAHLFNNAQVCMQESEYAYFTTTALYESQKSYFDELKKNDLLLLVNGDYIFNNHIMLLKTAGHTPGSQAVFIMVDHKKYLITGDEAYLHEHCTSKKPLSKKSLYNVENNMAFLEKATSMKNKRSAQLLTMHDPIHKQQFAEIEKNIFKIYEF